MAILREMESFILELGVGFCFVAVVNKSAVEIFPASSHCLEAMQSSLRPSPPVFNFRSAE